MPRVAFSQEEYLRHIMRIRAVEEALRREAHPTYRPDLRMSEAQAYLRYIPRPTWYDFLVRQSEAMYDPIRDASRLPPGLPEPYRPAYLSEYEIPRRAGIYPLRWGMARHPKL